MLIYRPDNFAELAATPEAQSLWLWLQRPSQRVTMQIACRLQRPAIEALSEDLIDQFPSLARSQKARQMIGHMVRQIMEDDGYLLLRSNVRISNRSNVFRRGATYRSVARMLA